MSANKWRHAMASGRNASPGRASHTSRTAATESQKHSLRHPQQTRQGVRPKIARYIAFLAVLLAYPWMATDFFTFQIGAQSMILGIIALSLAFLAGYGGMVSLSQMTVAGLAGYMMAIFGHSAMEQISLGWPWWLAAAITLVLSTFVATVIGMVSVRTDGIYTIMITLAIGVATFYLAQQNYTLFNGFQGFSGIVPPTLWGLDLRAPIPFYYLAMGFALLSYVAVKYVVRTPFGIALQGTRDNARRMRALGFNVAAHRVAAHAFAGLLAGIGGILLVWYNSQISPGTIGTSALINVLIVAVIGGMRHPLGAFIGALAFVLLQNFAIDLIDRERFNLVIGGAFLLILAFSPDGLVGIWHRVRAMFHPARKQ